MKFWRQTFITTICFFSIAATVLYTSCTKDSCADLACMNGGYCNAGYCVCPTGFVGPTCETRPTVAYLGTYTGYITVDVLPSVRDTVDVLSSPDSSSVYLVDHVSRFDTIHATVLTTQSTNIINIPLDSNASRKIYRSATVDVKQISYYAITTDYVNNLTTKSTFTGYKQ